MTEPFRFAEPDPHAVPIVVVTPRSLPGLLAKLDRAHVNWAKLQGFAGKPGEVLQLPSPDGGLDRVLVGAPPEPPRRNRFDLAKLAGVLPKGTYVLQGIAPGADLDEAALGWLLADYSFDLSQGAVPKRSAARLVAPDGIDAPRLEAIAQGEALTRDLINTPANLMGPDQIAAAAERLARDFGASCSSIIGKDLLSANFPLIHAVGRASDRAPRLIELRKGSRGPKLTLVGKGVAFDTGGLNLKPGASMGLMKKDMGGAATVLGLARMILAMDLPLQLRVLIPAVENAVSGQAFRPGDILTARNGLTVEVNNTDAEGRLVLADALALASEVPCDLLVSMATLTGAARVAVGPDIAPFYTDDDALARRLSVGGSAVCDPVWRLPFHEPYEAMIEPGIADLDNAPAGGFAGSITAALFLRRFVGQARYVHFDIYGWQPKSAPARPKGGVGQGARALFEALPDLLGL